MGAAGPRQKYDVSVLLRGVSVTKFAAAASKQIGALDLCARIVIYGHLGDGNLHLNVVDFTPEGVLLDELVLALVAAHDGSISAEHGIGRAKREMLNPTRSVAEIETMQAIKDKLLDPGGMLGAGRVLDAGSDPPTAPTAAPGSPA